MNGQPPNRRRRWVVDAAFQYRFTGLLLLQMVVVVAILGALVFSQVQRVRQAATEAPSNDTTVAAHTHRVLEDRIRPIYTWSLVLATATIVLLFVCGLSASHKLAGPVYKLKAYFRSLGGGNETGPLRFREGDRLNEFAANINNAVAAVAARKRRVDATLEGLTARISKLRSASPEARRGMVSDLRGLTSELKHLTQVEDQS